MWTGVAWADVRMLLTPSQGVPWSAATEPGTAGDAGGGPGHGVVNWVALPPLAADAADAAANHAPPPAARAEAKEAARAVCIGSSPKHSPAGMSAPSSHSPS